MSQLAFETSGSLQARSVSLVAAGNVNSSQLAILGSGPLSASCSRWVNAYIRERTASEPAAPGLAEGI